VPPYMASILAVQVISLFPIKAEPSMTRDFVNIFNNILWMGLCNGLNGRFCDCVDVAMRVALYGSELIGEATVRCGLNASTDRWWKTFMHCS
jgi:hypothetical protein